MKSSALRVTDRVRLSRRGLLQVGLFGWATIWVGGVIGCAARRVAPAAPLVRREALSPQGEEILRAIVPVVLGPLLPVDGVAREQAVDTGMATVDDYLARLSSPLQEEAHNLFATLDLWPVRVLLLGTWGCWRDASPHQVASFLGCARSSGVYPLRRIYAFVQSMAVLAWFDQPAAWPEVGYPGPPIKPIARLAEQV